MEYSFFELATKAYPIIKDKGYIKGETTNYIKNNYNDLSEKTSFVEIQDFVNWVEKRNNEKEKAVITRINGCNVGNDAGRLRQRRRSGRRPGGHLYGMG